MLKPVLIKLVPGAKNRVSMDVYAQVAEKIIKEQETIIGPIALEQARQVEGLQVNPQNHHVSFQGNKMDALDKLVSQYRKLFGQTSVEVCKDAARPFLSQFPPQEVPALLK